MAKWKNSTHTTQSRHAKTTKPKKKCDNQQTKSRKDAKNILEMESRVPYVGITPLGVHSHMHTNARDAFQRSLWIVVCFC